MTTRLSDLRRAITDGQTSVAGLLATFLETSSFTPEHYARYLSMQYHLTKGVQAYFFTAAGHADMSKRRKLRTFLIAFANEEESHYLLALHDLQHMKHSLEPTPFDVELWHLYFSQVVATRPFVRLGAACFLENVSSGAVAPLIEQLRKAPFLTRENTTFISIHMHEALPHGDQFFEHLEDAGLASQHISDLFEGARKAALLYTRMLQWVLICDPAQRLLCVQSEPAETA